MDIDDNPFATNAFDMFADRVLDIVDAGDVCPRWTVASRGGRRCIKCRKNLLNTHFMDPKTLAELTNQKEIDRVCKVRAKCNRCRQVEAPHAKKQLEKDKMMRRYCRDFE